MARLGSWDLTGNGPTWFDVDNDPGGVMDRDYVPKPKPVPPPPPVRPKRIRLIPEPPSPQSSGGASGPAIRERRLWELFEPRTPAPVIVWEPPKRVEPSPAPGDPLALRGPQRQGTDAPPAPESEIPPTVVIVEVDRVPSREAIAAMVRAELDKILVDASGAPDAELGAAAPATEPARPAEETPAPLGVVIAEPRSPWRPSWLLVAAAVAVAVVVTVLVVQRQDRPRALRGRKAPARLKPKSRPKRKKPRTR